MLTYTFPYYISFGKGDSSDNKIEIELTEKEAERLVDSLTKQYRLRLSEDENIADIYDKVLEQVIQVEIESLRGDDEYMREVVGEYLELDEAEIEKYDFSDEEITEYLTDYLEIGVNYPEEIQEGVGEDVED